MYCVICPLGIRRITSDVKLVQAAVTASQAGWEWQVWHNGRRVW